MYMSFERHFFSLNLIFLTGDVADIGVTVSYTPNGVTRKAFDKVLAAFPAPRKIINEK